MPNPKNRDNPIFRFLGKISRFSPWPFPWLGGVSRDFQNPTGGPLWGDLETLPRWAWRRRSQSIASSSGHSGEKRSSPANSAKPIR